MSFEPYNLLRGLHILSVLAWMAGLLMLPRLYAYQTEAQPGGELEHKMIEAAGRLRTIILNPAMIATWVFGLWLLIVYHLPGGIAGWLWIKLALVLALSGVHGFLIGQGRKLNAGQRPLSSKTWRMLNEIPFVIAIPVVLLVTLKPF
jgi:putative membrane protein